MDEFCQLTMFVLWVFWLLVDKFVGEALLKNLLLDKLGGKMGALYDYGQRKELKGIKEGMEKV